MEYFDKHTERGSMASSSMTSLSPMSFGTKHKSTLAKIKHLDLTECLSVDDRTPDHPGRRSSGVRVGTCNIQGRGKVRVFVKEITLRIAPSPITTEAIERELYGWSRLKHANILPLFGYCVDVVGRPSPITEFMENGNVLQYARRHPGSDIKHLILGIAEGVGYLHDKGIIHSNLKSSNILVSDQGVPLVCDFILPRIISSLGDSEVVLENGMDGDMEESPRWMSPELLLPPEHEHLLPPEEQFVTHTRESDIWAFGMIAYELLAKELPYYRLDYDPQIIKTIVSGRLPDKPEISEKWTARYGTIWKLCEDCWQRQPSKRPRMNVIVARMKVIAGESIWRVDYRGLLQATLSRMRHLDLTNRLTYDTAALPFHGGGLGNVQIALCDIAGRDEIKVAVRHAHTHSQHLEDPEVVKFVERELRLWSSLKHANVLPPIGFSIEQTGLPSLVSVFMENGNILRYVRSYPNLDIMHMIVGIAEGLGYLHERGVIHSDLKSGNVLVSMEGEPLLSDFGLLRAGAIAQNFSGHGTQVRSIRARGSPRWMAPELLSPEDQFAPHTKEADIWAFGMTISELLTKEVPYFLLQSDSQVISAIIFDRLPQLPEISYGWPAHYHKVWKLCEMCWAKDPTARPKIDAIISRLKDIVSRI